MDIDSNSFVPVNIQRTLHNSGWRLDYSSFESDKANRRLYLDGKIGMQVWKRGSIQLDIHYDCTGKDKNVTLWYNDNDTEEFKLRTILSVLARRGLL